MNAAAHVGGAGSLTMRQELEPASGPDGVIAPAKYVDDRGNATYIFAKRYEEDQEKPVKTVMIDSKGSFANPFIRANCFLAETGKPTVMLNKRYGEKEELEPLTAGMAEKLLEEAYAQAHEKAGITWEGQEFLVEGNPAVLANASAEDDEKGN